MNLRFILLTFCCLSVFSLEKMRVLQVSSSGKSLELNFGKVDGLKRGSSAIFYTYDESSKTYKAFGEAEALRVKNKSSYWYIKNLTATVALEAGKSISADVNTLVLRGRNSQSILRQKSYLALKRESHGNGQKSLPVPKDLVRAIEGYRPGKELTTTKEVKTHSIEVIEKTPYVEGARNHYQEELNQDLGIVRATDLENTPSNASVKKDIDQDIFEGISDEEISLINESGMGEDFPQKYVPDEIKNPNEEMAMSSPNEFEVAQDREKEKDQYREKAKRRIKKSGPLWSAGMTDSELRKYFVKTGVIEEKYRQKRVSDELLSHEFRLEYNTTLVGETTESDKNNQGKNSSIGIGYEYMLGWTSKSLINWSIEGVLEKASSYYEIIEGTNGKFSTTSIRFGVNWYPFVDPTQIRRFIPYLGFGIKRGNGSLSSQSSESYSVSANGFSPFFFGLKFRFSGGDEYEHSKVGWGMYSRLSFGTLKMTITDTVTDSTNGSYSINDNKLTFGVSAYF